MITTTQALRIIRTWAAFDIEEKSQMALLPEHVRDLCDAVLQQKGGDTMANAKTAKKRVKKEKVKKTPKPKAEK